MDVISSSTIADGGHPWSQPAGVLFPAVAEYGKDCEILHGTRFAVTYS